VTGMRATVFAQVQMAVEPSIGRDERRDVPSAAAEIGDEDGPVGGAAGERAETGRKEMALMAMNNVGTAQMSEHR